MWTDQSVTMPCGATDLETRFSMSLSESIPADIVRISGIGDRSLTILSTNSSSVEIPSMAMPGSAVQTAKKNASWRFRVSDVAFISPVTRSA